MLKYFMITFAALSSPAFAASGVATFYHKVVTDRWEVVGAVMKEQLIGPTCMVRQNYQDGSHVDLSQDIDENHLFLWVETPEWTFHAPPGTETSVNVMFADDKNHQTSRDFRAVIPKENNVDIPLDDDPKGFLDIFLVSTKIVLTVKGLESLPKTVDIGIYKGPLILDELSTCIDYWHKLKKRITSQDTPQSRRRRH